MDSKDIQPPPRQPQPGMQTSYDRNDPNAAALTGRTGASRRLSSGSLAPQQHHSQARPSQQQLLGLGLGSPSSHPMTSKRGRARKYAPANTALRLSSKPPLPSGRDGGEGDNADSVEPPAKQPVGGKPGEGFTLHLIEVNAGEDINSRIMTFSEIGSRTLCIVSGIGAVSSVTLTHSSNPIKTITSKGPFDIITLAGSFMNHEVDGYTQISGRLTVALVRPDGQVFGGVVAGPLIAATQAQVTVGSFVVEQTELKQRRGRGNNARGQNPEPASAPANMLNLGSNSQGPSSESSVNHESSSSRDKNNNDNENYGKSVSQQQQQQQQLRQFVVG